MSAPRTRTFHGKLRGNDHPTKPENVKRLDLVSEGDDWYIEFPDGFESGGVDAGTGAPPDKVTFDSTTEITVVRRVNAGEFMRFLAYSQRWAELNNGQPVIPPPNGSRSGSSKSTSKVSQVAVDFGMGGGGGSNSSNTDEFDIDEYENWPSCPSTLGFRC